MRITAYIIVFFLALSPTCFAEWPTKNFRLLRQDLVGICMEGASHFYAKAGDEVTIVGIVGILPNPPANSPHLQILASTQILEEITDECVRCSKIPCPDCCRKLAVVRLTSAAMRAITELKDRPLRLSLSLERPESPRRKSQVKIDGKYLFLDSDGQLKSSELGKR